MLFSKQFRKPWLACLLAVTSVLSLPATAQVQTLKKILEKQTEAQPEAASEKPDDVNARLQQWQKEARESLARLEDPAAAGSQPAGITAADLEERRRNTEQTVLTVGRYIKALETSTATAKSVEEARQEDAAWVGFKEKPPYPIMMVDELRNEQDAVQEKLSSYSSSMVVFQRTLAEVLNETKANEDSANKLTVDGDEVAKWRLDASRTKSRLLAARAGLIQCNCEILGYQIEVAKSELSLLGRKIKTAKVGARFRDEDLAKIRAASDDRRASFRKEIENIAKRQKVAVTTRKQERAALDALVASAPEGTAAPGLEMAKFRADIADERVDTLQSISEGLENLNQLESLTLDGYQDRKKFLDATSPDLKAKSLASLNALLDRLKAWEIFSNNEISGVTADLSKLDSRSASVAAGDPRMDLLVDQRKIKAEKLAVYQRISQSVVTQRRLLQRWVDDFTPKKEEPRNLYRGVSTLTSNAWAMAQAVWSFEVTHTEEKFEVDGQVFTKKTPVTLGDLLRAVFFFTIAYGILARVANKIQGTVVSRGHVADAQARTLRNWAMIVVGVFLAIGTLSILKIPITVFAFFGGALAIGLGFGSQTLIKNFICGIIVLFERKIRVGDIVDVGGLAGSVTEINTRSSVLRSGDGKETLIPNSYFLENRVTNLTLSNRRVRRTLRVGVAYGSQPQNVTAALKECVERHGLVLKDPAPVVTLDDFGDTALVFMIYFWTEFNDKTNGDVVASDIRFMIEKRFSELEIKLAAAERDMLVRMGQPLQMEWVNKPAE
ncbi:MAG: mechanosensitive ion channel domain-containing protein [Luteolibacter sp.]